MRLLRLAALAAAALLCGCSTLMPLGHAPKAGYTWGADGSLVAIPKTASEFVSGRYGIRYGQPSSAISLVDCASATPCTKNGPVNTGTGDPSYAAFGKQNANWQVIENMFGATGLLLGNGDIPNPLTSLAPSTTGTFCFAWANISAAPTLVSCPSGSSTPVFGGVLSGTNANLSPPTQGVPSTATTGGLLAASTTFYFKIVAVNGNGTTTPSGEQSITTGSGTSTNTVTANWSTVTNATSYQFWFGTSSGSESEYFAVSGGSTTSYVLTTLSGATSGTLPTTNTTGAAMVVGTGSSLGVTGSGTIAATTSLALATTPTQCSGSQFATGVAANGNANCGTPAGGAPGGSTTQIQFNNSGALAGASNITYSLSTGDLAIGTPTNGTPLSVTSNFNNVTQGWSSTGGTINGTLDLSFDVNGNAFLLGNAGLYLGASGSGSLNLETSNVDRMFINSTGNLGINAPSSGVALAVTAQGTNFAETYGATGNATNGAGGIGFDSSGSMYLESTVGALNVGTTTATGFNILTNGSSRFNVNSNGGVTVNAPASGVALTTNGLPSQFTALFQASTTTGASAGPRINAGTNSSDDAFQVANAAGTTNYFNVLGDGGIVVGAATGGDKGVGTVNMAGCYVNGVTCGGGSGTVNSGTTNQIAYYSASGTAVSGSTTLPTSAMPAISGDVTISAGTTTATVSKVNGASIPASANCASTNALSQVVSGCQEPLGNSGAVITASTYSAGSTDCGRQDVLENASGVTVTVASASSAGAGCQIDFVVPLGYGASVLNPTSGTLSGNSSIPMAVNTTCTLNTPDGLSWYAIGCPATILPKFNSTALAVLEDTTNATVSGCTPSASSLSPSNGGSSITQPGTPCTTVTFTYSVTAPHGWICTMNDETQVNTGTNFIPPLMEASSTTTSCTFKIPAWMQNASDVLVVVPRWR